MFARSQHVAKKFLDFEKRKEKKNRCPSSKVRVKTPATTADVAAVFAAAAVDVYDASIK